VSTATQKSTDILIHKVTKFFVLLVEITVPISTVNKYCGNDRIKDLDPENYFYFTQLTAQYLEFTIAIAFYWRREKLWTLLPNNTDHLETGKNGAKINKNIAKSALNSLV
jgi:hypothetical protein